jgi:FKBP-type peptidyl-prolyl cis-trans isomerase (trigger factor)
MNITHLQDDGARKVLRVDAPWSEIADDYKDLVARYAKVRMPGFRQGKAPQTVIEQRFKKEMKDELKVLVTRRLGREALRAAGARAIGSFEVFEIECDTGKPFAAKLRYYPMPEFDLPELAELTTVDDGTAARDRISHRLLDLVTFEVPDELVRQELALDGLMKSMPGSGTWTAAVDRIRLMLVLKKIARREGIDVDETDVSKRVAEKAAAFGTTEEALRKELEAGGGIHRLLDLLLAERTLEYIEHRMSEGS